MPAFRRAFYDRDCVDVARALLGAHLVLREPGARGARPPPARIVRIVETEAYIGPEDRASHASRGRTPRNDPMFGPPGRAYVYFVYGMHWCLNAVTGAEGFPAAVLIRAGEPVAGVDASPSGPGRLCRALGIDARYNRADLTRPPLTIERAPAPPAEPIACGPRIGVHYAGDWAARPLRFWLEGNPWVSRPATGRRGATGR